MISDIPPTVTPALSAALSADREHYNAHLAALRSRQPGLDFKSIKDFLCAAVDPIAQSVQTTAPDRCRFVIKACFQQMLVLAEHGLLRRDERSARIQNAWQQLIPKLPLLLAHDPLTVLAWLSNAIDHIGSTAGACPALWLTGMVQIGPHVETMAQLRAAGQILAWRAGLAHYRRGALQQTNTLPDSLGKALFPPLSSNNWKANAERHAREPWWRGTNHLEVEMGTSQGVRVGAFAGWDGTFIQPPKLRIATEGFWVVSGDSYFHLVADAFGAVLLPSSEAHFAAPVEHDSCRDDVRHHQGHIETRQGRWPLLVPEEGLVLTCRADTVALSSPWSHHIWLYPR